MAGHPMSRRQFAQVTAAVAAPIAFPSLRRRSPPWRTPSWPGYDSAVVIDCLASPGPFNVANRTAHPLSAEMLRNVRLSGITAVNVTVSGGGTGHEPFHSTVQQLAYWERELAVHRDRLTKVRTLADLDEAKASSRLGLIYGFQDASMLEGDLERLELFHRFGVKIIQLTYNLRNQLGDGCLESGNAGLSRFGRDVVERMNEIGMVVDLAHCGQRTTADAIEHSAGPVAITHSGCRAVYDHPRSKRDEELRAMADKGGVIGIYMMPFLNADGPAQTEHFIQHVEHAINVCGEDHVGVGSDNSITPTVADDEYLENLYAFADARARQGIGAPREHEVLLVEGLNEARRMEIVADALLARGHGDTRIEKIMGTNFVRLFEDTWR